MNADPPELQEPPGRYVEVQITTSVDCGDLLALLSDSEPLGGWECGGSLRLYWPEERWTPIALEELRKAVRLLGGSGEDPRPTMEVIPDRDWNARWAQSLQPIRIGRRLLVRQSWNTACVPPHGIELIIDPGQAFGSGYHATTQLLLVWLEERICGGEHVLDVGTGSGILAMAALRLGAASAVAIDNDPLAIACAKANALVNGFASELDLRVGAVEDIGAELFDIAVANIDRRVLLAEGSRLGRNLRPGSSLLLSGLQVEDLPDISEALAAGGGSLMCMKTAEEWVALEVQFSESARGNPA